MMVPRNPLEHPDGILGSSLPPNLSLAFFRHLESESTWESPLVFFVFFLSLTQSVFQIDQNFKMKRFKREFGYIIH